MPPTLQPHNSTSTASTPSLGADSPPCPPSPSSDHDTPRTASNAEAKYLKNLERVRENQRRSRARRKNRQQDLEQRLRLIDKSRLQATMDMQELARRVAGENARLKAHLNSVAAARTRHVDSAFGALGDLTTAFVAPVRTGEADALGETDSYLVGLAQKQGGTRAATATQSRVREDQVRVF